MPARELAITITADSSNTVSETNEPNKQCDHHRDLYLAPYAISSRRRLKLVSTGPITTNPAVFDVEVTVQNQGDGRRDRRLGATASTSTDSIIGNADDR